MSSNQCTFDEPRTELMLKTIWTRGLRRRFADQDYVRMLTNKLYIDKNSTVKKGLRRLCSVIVTGHYIRWTEIVQKIPSDNYIQEFIYKIHILCTYTLYRG